MLIVFQDLAPLLAKIPPSSFIFYGKFGDKSSQSRLFPPPCLLQRWLYNYWFQFLINYHALVRQSSNYSKFVRFVINSAIEEKVETIIEFNSLKWLQHCLCIDVRLGNRATFGNLRKVIGCCRRVSLQTREYLLIVSY